MQFYTISERESCEDFSVGFKAMKGLRIASPLVGLLIATSVWLVVSKLPH